MSRRWRWRRSGSCVEAAASATARAAVVRPLRGAARRASQVTVELASPGQWGSSAGLRLVDDACHDAAWRARAGLARGSTRAGSAGTQGGAGTMPPVRRCASTTAETTWATSAKRCSASLPSSCGGCGACAGRRGCSPERVGCRHGRTGVDPRAGGPARRLRPGTAPAPRFLDWPALGPGSPRRGRPPLHVGMPRESARSRTRNAMRRLTLAWISAVTTPEGRWVARTRWTPRGPSEGSGPHHPVDELGHLVDQGSQLVHDDDEPRDLLVVRPPAAGTRRGPRRPRPQTSSRRRSSAPRR